MQHQHAVVWIDHREAHILSFGLTGSDRQILRSKQKEQHLHHKANSIGSGRVERDLEFFERLAAALKGVSALLVTGPATAKHEFVHYIGEHNPALAKAVEGVETVDHPSEGELLKFARVYLKGADRFAR